MDEDRASDRRFAITLGVLLAVEVVLAGVADAGAIALWLWLVLAVGAVLATGVVSALVRHRTEGTPLVDHRHRPAGHS
jgi:hypothetical protein